MVSVGQREPKGLVLMGSGCDHKVLEVIQVKNSPKIGNFGGNLAAFWDFWLLALP